MPPLAGTVLLLAGLLVRRRVRRLGEAVVPAAAYEEFRALSIALIACGILVVLVPAGWMVYTKHAVDETQIQALETWQAASQPTDSTMVLMIPSLDLRRYVPDGASPDQLKQFGVGRINWTTLPDADGAVGIAGHRTTYGAPFFRLDRLRQGDEIAVDFRGQRYTYRVERLETVHPTQVEVLQAQAGERVIALVTCAPAYSAAQRLVVLGRLEAVASLGAR